MEVRVSKHTLLRAAKRGVTPEEIVDVVRTRALGPSGGRTARARESLYLSLDDSVQQVRCQELNGSIILDLGPDDRIVGIEILDASKRVPLDQISRQCGRLAYHRLQPAVSNSYLLPLQLRHVGAGRPKR